MSANSNLTLQRAVNYFTISELMRWSHAKVASLWEFMVARELANKPLTDIPVTDLESLGLASVGLREVYRKVEASMRRLADTDRIIEFGHPDYPDLLGGIERPPQFLFLRGNRDLLGLRAVSVVGTRRPSPVGEQRAFKIGYLLAKAGVVVASGLARGIDAFAHRGALAAGGDTMAVIGTPLTTTYPPEHKRLQWIIGETGLVVSQFYPGARVRKFFFPMRNAVMSGLSLGTIVVEASESSGALIQARECLKQGRKLFVPKSAVDNPRLAWPKRFAAQGAVVFAEVEDLLDALQVHDLLPSVGRDRPHTAPQVQAHHRELVRSV